VTAASKYDIVYDDYDEEEMGEADFEIYKMKAKYQVVAKFANVQSSGKMRTIATVPLDTVTTSGLRTQVDSTQKKGGEHLQPIFGCKDPISGRHCQELLHLMLISMRLPALHI